EYTQENAQDADDGNGIRDFPFQCGQSVDGNLGIELAHDFTQRTSIILWARTGTQQKSHAALGVLQKRLVDDWATWRIPPIFPDIADDPNDGEPGPVGIGSAQLEAAAECRAIWPKTLGHAFANDRDGGRGGGVRIGE